MTLPPLGLLQREALRKLAMDCGFDLLRDDDAWVEAASTQAPLRAWLGRQGTAPVCGLSMLNVLAELSAERIPAPPDAPAGAMGWLRCPDGPSLDRVLSRAWALSRALPDELQHRYEDAVGRVGATEREATVRQRVGQSLFRDGLMTLWGGRCAVTGIDVPALLRASHAKPWAMSNDAERLDVYNGLLLVAHLDAAFDAGLIAVAADGEILASPRLDDGARALLGIDGRRVGGLSPGHEVYLAWHRDWVFLR